MHPSLVRATLDSLTAGVAVMNARGVIVGVNAAWKRFAAHDGGDRDAAYVGSSYLEACERAIERGASGEAAAVLAALARLRKGESEGFVVEYPCPSPSEERWFLARLTRFRHEGLDYVVAAHEDVTERHLAQQRLQQTEDLLRQVLETLPVGVWILDARGTIVHGNPAGRHIWGGARFVGPEQFGQYRGWWASSGEPIRAEEWAAARAIRNGETSIEEEVRIERFDGRPRFILNSALPLRDATGAITGAIVVNQDITDRKLAEQRLQQASADVAAANRRLTEVLSREQVRARTDELTGLGNRRHFEEAVEPLLAGARRYGTPLSILLFDLDHFKQVNDTYGHAAGDVLLRCVARVARSQLRDADVLARHGGEEFVAALPNTEVPEALKAAEHLRTTVASCREAFDGSALGVTISIGVAELPPGDAGLDSLVRRADRALYAAKHAGRNCCRVAGP